VLRERVARTLEAREIDENELVVVAGRDAADPVAGRLRLVRDDRDLAAAERVHERRLAHVRAAGDGHETAPRRRGLRHHGSVRAERGGGERDVRGLCPSGEQPTIVR
jgi:hypothetical protein